MVCDVGLDIHHEKIIEKIISWGNMTLLRKLYNIDDIRLNPDVNYYRKLRFDSLRHSTYTLQFMHEMIDFLVQKIGVKTTDIQILLSRMKGESDEYLDYDDDDQTENNSVRSDYQKICFKLLEYITMHNLSITLNHSDISFLLAITIDDEPKLLEQCLETCQIDENIILRFKEFDVCPKICAVLSKYNILYQA